MATGLFGPTPEAVQAAIANERLAQASAIGQMPLGTLPGVMGGFALSDAIGDITGFQDPRLRRAQTMQQIQAEVSQRGLQPGSRDFTEYVVNRARALGDEEMAIQAFQLGNQLEQDSLKTQKARQDVAGAAVDPSVLERRFRGLVLAGMEPEIAQTIAPNEKAFRETMATLIKPRNPPEAIQKYQMAVTQGYDGTFLEYQKELRRSGASNVTVNVDKPLSVSDLSKLRTQDGRPLPVGTTTRQAADAAARGDVEIITPEQEAAIKQREVDKAKREPQMRELNKAIEEYERLSDQIESSPLSAISRDVRVQHEVARTRAAKAAAQLRNPPGTEASGQAEDRFLNVLPGAASIAGQIGGARGAAEQLRREVDGGGGVEDAVRAQLPPGAKIKSIRRIR